MAEARFPTLYTSQSIRVSVMTHVLREVPSGGEKPSVRTQKQLRRQFSSNVIGAWLICPHVRPILVARARCVTTAQKALCRQQDSDQADCSDRDSTYRLYCYHSSQSLCNNGDIEYDEGIMVKTPDSPLLWCHDIGQTLLNFLLCQRNTFSFGILL